MAMKVKLERLAISTRTVQSLSRSSNDTRTGKDDGCADGHMYYIRLGLPSEPLKSII